MNEKEFFDYIENVDIKEDHLAEIDIRLLQTLLKDNSTNKNIIWATSDYQSYGKSFAESAQIFPELITKVNGNIIKPRTEKSKDQQQLRSKDKAEVFTPSWVCNAQNNLVDSEWFGRENVFNQETDKRWTTNIEKIVFPEGKTWQDYVNSNRLEITCGEAPYLVSRYDTVSGELIAVKDRIGILDRKIRIVSENAENEQEWLLWAEKALKSTYGFEWQGDNLLLARENILYSVIDAHNEIFNASIDIDTLLNFAEIISWNIWQMDGLKYVVPNSCTNEIQSIITLFGEEIIENKCEGCAKNNPHKHNGTYCYIMDWDENKKIRFLDLIKG